MRRPAGPALSPSYQSPVNRRVFETTPWFSHTPGFPAKPRLRAERGPEKNKPHVVCLCKPHDVLEIPVTAKGRFPRARPVVSDLHAPIVPSFPRRHHAGHRGFSAARVYSFPSTAVFQYPGLDIETVVIQKPVLMEKEGDALKNAGKPAQTRRKSL